MSVRRAAPCLIESVQVEYGNEFWEDPVTLRYPYRIKLDLRASDEFLERLWAFFEQQETRVPSSVPRAPRRLPPTERALPEPETPRALPETVAVVEGDRATVATTDPAAAIDAEIVDE